MGASTSAAAELPITATTTSVGQTLTTGTNTFSQIIETVNSVTTVVVDPVPTVNGTVDGVVSTVTDAVNGVSGTVGDTGGLTGKVEDTVGGLNGSVSESVLVPGPGARTDLGTDISARVGEESDTTGGGTGTSDSPGSGLIDTVGDTGTPAVVHLRGRSLPEAIVTAAGGFAVPLLMLAGLALGLAVAPLRADIRLAVGPTPNDELLPFE